jgi:hypothetical protein
LYYLLGRPNAPIVEVKEGGKLKYYTLTVCERFKELGFLTKEQFATLEAARGNGQKKYKKRKIK